MKNTNALLVLVSYQFLIATSALVYLSSLEMLEKIGERFFEYTEAVQSSVKKKMIAEEDDSRAAVTAVAIR